MNAAALFMQPAHTSLTGAHGAAATSVPFRGDPKLSILMSHLQYEFANHKYTVYRCAAKFVKLQKVFYTSNIPFKLVLAVLGRHEMREAHCNLMVPPFQLTSLIHDIYFACEKLGHFTKSPAYQLDTATGVLANFFWNIFDAKRRHSISVLEVKVTFLLLCKLYNSDQLVSEFHSLIRDSKTNCVSKLNFEYLLNILSKLMSYIGEATAYGAHNTPLILEQCYARQHNAAGLTEYQFHCLWTTTQSRFLIYANLIALIKRIEDTEKIIHSNSCTACGMEKIIGIRFKCKSCKQVSLCMRCFATGYSTNKHEAGHRMYEVFTEDSPPKKFTHYFAKLCNVFNSSNSNEETRGFCNSNETASGNETELVTIAINNTSNGPTSTSATLSNKSPDHKSENSKDSNTSPISHASIMNASNVSERLQSIIDRLVEQNMKLERQLQRVQTSTTEQISEFLSSHQQFLIEIINEMRNFSHVTSSYPTSSTPNRSLNANKPIIVDSFGNTGGNLTHSINGADVNRSYLDANKSDYSISDLSLWFNQRKTPLALHAQQILSALPETFHDMSAASIAAVDMRDKEMANFRLLLQKVKEIVEDSYSDNTELAEATQNLENVLDSIILNEETRRRST